MPSVTVEIDGKEYTGQYVVNDVGKGKVMFEVSYGDLHHHDSSVFKKGETQIDIWVKSELKQLVQQKLAMKKS